MSDTCDRLLKPRHMSMNMSMVKALLLILGLSLSATGWTAVVYKYVDRKGTTVYTNKRPGGGVAVKSIFVYCPACDPASKVDWTKTGLNVDAYKREVLHQSGTHGIDPAFVRAIIHAESAFNPNALSKAGAMGLMQLMPGTASDFGVSDRLDPAENIRGGVAYLRFLMDMFDGNADLVSAAYNAGQNAVLRYTGIPPYEETQVYVQRVAVLYKRYRDELAKATLTAQR